MVKWAQTPMREEIAVKIRKPVREDQTVVLSDMSLEIYNVHESYQGSLTSCHARWS